MDRSSSPWAACLVTAGLEALCFTQKIQLITGGEVTMLTKIFLTLFSGGVPWCDQAYKTGVCCPHPGKTVK